MLDAVDALLNGDGSKPGVTCATGTPNYGDFIDPVGEAGALYTEHRGGRHRRHGEAAADQRV